jgi:hypothetical protein
MVDEESTSKQIDEDSKQIDEIVSVVIDEEPEQIDEIVSVVIDEEPEQIDEIVSVVIDEESKQIDEIVNVVIDEDIRLVTQDVSKTVTKKMKLPEVILKTLSDIFLDFIKKNSDSNVGSSKYIDILNKIINVSPTFLYDIEKSLLEVVKDGKIDSNDIPSLILLIQKLYETIYRIKDVKLDSKTRTVICSEALKIIVYFLITERRIKIDEANSALFLEQINLLIDSCVGLLSFSKTLKVKGCFDSLFGKK